MFIPNNPMGQGNYGGGGFFGGGLGKFLGGPGLGLGLMGAGALAGFLAPNKEREMRLYQARMSGLLSPEAINAQTQGIYNLSSASPMARLARQNIGLSASGMRRGMERNLSARGLLTSGIGSVAGPMAESAAGNNMNQFNAALWAQAQQQAMQALMAQAGGMSQYAMTPSMQQQILGALIGAGGQSLSDWMRYRGNRA